MGEYISRENITERLERVIEHGVPNTMGTHSITAEATLEVIREIPAADVVEVRHGRLLNPNPYGECSLCGYLMDIRDGYKYCPSCGAKMDGGQDE